LPRLTDDNQTCFLYSSADELLLEHLQFLFFLQEKETKEGSGEKDLKHSPTGTLKTRLKKLEESREKSSHSCWFSQLAV